MKTSRICCLCCDKRIIILVHVTSQGSLSTLYRLQISLYLPYSIINYHIYNTRFVYCRRHVTRTVPFTCSVNGTRNQQRLLPRHDYIFALYKIIFFPIALILLYFKQQSCFHNLAPESSSQHKPPSVAVTEPYKYQLTHDAVNHRLLVPGSSCMNYFV